MQDHHALFDILKTIYQRDLTKLKQELELYSNEVAIWRIDKDISNSAGNLCLHLVGNLNTYIGAVLGETGYVRNRPQEFSAKNVSREELIDKIEETMKMIDTVLDSLTEAQLTAVYPQVVLETTVTTQFFLVHLATHLGYHLGQVNYHRRLLDDKDKR